MKRKLEANRMLESLTAIKSGEFAQPAEMIHFDELRRAYLEPCSRGRDGRLPVATSTYRTNNGYLENHIIPLMGDLRLPQITQMFMNHISNELLEKCKGRQTAKQLFVLARAILAYGVRQGLIDRNPADGIVVSDEIRTSRAKKLKSFTDEEARRLIEAAPRLRDSPNKQVPGAWARYFPFLLLLLHTVLRASEALAVK